MKIISCDNCGVILDADKLPFAPESRTHLDDGSMDLDRFTWDGSIDLDRFTWDGSKYVAYCQCPVCSDKITQ